MAQGSYSSENDFKNISKHVLMVEGLFLDLLWYLVQMLKGHHCLTQQRQEPAKEHER